MIDTDFAAPPAPRGAAPRADRETEMREAAKALETVFLSEMLKPAGLDDQAGEFSGGIGESQFASFQRNEQARIMVEAGGIGLAEQIFEALKARAS